MAKTAEGLLKHCKEVVENKVQYVYGCKMEILTNSIYTRLKSMYGSLVWGTDISKVGKICCDCSGLISSYTDIVRNSAGYKSTAIEVATIAQLRADWKKYVGWGIWLNGHIGVVSDTEGYYYAMDGSSRNAVHYPISKQNWTYVVKLKDIEYPSISGCTGATANTENKTEAVAGSGIDVYYRVYADSKWYDEVVNYNNTSADGYAGAEGKPIHCVMARLSRGKIKSRVHTKGGRWLPWVDGYNPSDHDNGYAGEGNKEIDGVQFCLEGLEGYDVCYRVSTTSSSDYLPWVKNTEDYAGIFGKGIDKVQIEVKKW